MALKGSEAQEFGEMKATVRHLADKLDGHIATHEILRRDGIAWKQVWVTGFLAIVAALVGGVVGALITIAAG